MGLLGLLWLVDKTGKGGLAMFLLRADLLGLQRLLEGVNRRRSTAAREKSFRKRGHGAIDERGD